MNANELISREDQEQFIFMMTQFLNCEWKEGDRVRKIAGEEEDHHKVGDEGVLLGGANVGDQEAYLVEFDNDGPQTMTFILKEKLEKI